MVPALPPNCAGCRVGQRLGPAQAGARWHGRAGRVPRRRRRVVRRRMPIVWLRGAVGRHTCPCGAR
eukprot:9870213-Alexandrium_andersonii.AAC.1